MIRRSFPWTILILTFVVALLGIGLMEYMRYDQKSKNEALEKQVKEATTKATALRNREKKLKQHEAERTALEGRLMKAADGQIHGQTLMTMVAAARSAGVTTGPLSLAGKDEKAGAAQMPASLQVSGTEAQVLHFLTLLEQGKPLTQVRTVTWSLPIQKGQEAGSGSVSLQLRLFRDQAEVAPPPPKPAAKPEEDSKP